MWIYLEKFIGKSFFSVFLLSVLFFVPSFSFADEYASDSFKVLDPVIQSANFATSSSFQLWSTISEIALGLSTTTSFQLGASFLRFPFASSPSAGATGGDSQVSLSWSASDGFLGWNPTSYSVGQSTVSGGPYSYSNVGNVLSSIRSGLSNGTTYYFVIVVNDALGISVATSTQVSGTPVAGAAPPPSGGGGGGGGGTIFSGVTFSGRAYPKSSVTFLKDAQVIATTIAGADANFSATISNLSSGNYIFSIYSEDKDGNRSGLLTFPVSLTYGATSNVSGIFLAPTISVDKSEVRRGDDIAIFGQSIPQADVIISVNSEEEFFGKTISDKDGVYLYNFDTSLLEYGSHSTRSKSSIGNQLVSGFSPSAGFRVGTKNILQIKKKFLRGDLNNDGKVNLIDFSVASYWYKRTLSGDFKVKEIERLNADGKVDLKDFSIMAFYWTG